MPAFSNAHDFTIYGAQMNDVQGDQTINDHSTNSMSVNSGNTKNNKIDNSYNDYSSSHVQYGNTHNNNNGNGTFNHVVGEQNNGGTQGGKQHPRKRKPRAGPPPAVPLPPYDYNRSHNASYFHTKPAPPLHTQSTPTQRSMNPFAQPSASTPVPAWPASYYASGNAYGEQGSQPEDAYSRQHHQGDEEDGEEEDQIAKGYADFDAVYGFR